MTHKQHILANRIKRVINEMINQSYDKPMINFSVYISQKLNMDYNYLSNVFSVVNGETIQQFVINMKIEKAKELIMDNKLNLTEISKKLHYSSVAHLSNQFKKITGLTPSLFKKQNQEKEIIPLD